MSDTGVQAQAVQADNQSAFHTNSNDLALGPRHLG